MALSLWCNTPEVPYRLRHGRCCVVVAMLRCLHSGTMLAQYQVGRLLGQGGMGHVYAAIDTLLNRQVALKVLRRGDRKTLLEEGRALAAIEHGSVVRIYGVDVTGDNPFVVMERIRGEALAALLERRGALPHGEVLQILDGIARGLDAIHRAGRIHGDVKPANVLIERDTGRVVLTDLGLSRVIARAEHLRGGTPEYLAPERARGAPVKAELLPREDVYSLAVMAFEMLTGALPFDAPDSQEVLRLHAVARPPRPSRAHPSVTWRIDRAVLHGLEKSPEDRPASASVFVDGLRRAVRDANRPADLLVADDDVGLLELLSVQLTRRLRCSVRTAACGEAAFEAAALRAPDAVIVDLEMPGMNGLEVVAALRQRPGLEGVPFVVVSGRASANDWSLLRRLGAVRFFRKPVDIEGLSAFLRGALYL